MRGPLSYIGGKNRLANTILSIFPDHKTYCEAFAGGSQVLFRKMPSEVEVLNDLDGEVVNFYRICQSHYEELIRYMRFTLNSREWFDRLQRTPPDCLTDVQRAARYFFLQKMAYGGRVVRQNYAYHVFEPPKFTPALIPKLIEQAHKRLERVQIECSSYEKILERYDSKTTLFYLDPPYYGIALYRHNLENDDFVKMEDRLRDLKGKFILSLNDVPEVRKLFSRFNLHQVELSYSLQPKAGRRYKELLITNY